MSPSAWFRRARIVVLAGVVWLSVGRGPGAEAGVGPRTTPFDAGRYAARCYVDGGRGDDANGDGTSAHPWASLNRALESAPPASGRLAILVSAGRYRPGTTLALKPRVDIYGGFAAPDGLRNLGHHATVIDGDDAVRLLLAASDAQVDGVTFARGRVRGKGAAVLCDGVSPVFTNCSFTGNRTLAPRPWEPAQIHLTAHDGGAVMCLNAAAPRFEHCLFYDNTTEVGRGGALAADRGAAPRLIRCVFANNRSGLDDAMRSSDGGAISLFDHAGGEVTGCVIVANRALTRNDAGGVFVALWSAPRLVDNVVVGNHGADDAGGLFLGGQEHRYGVPLDAYPPADRFQIVVERNVFVGNANTSLNSGAMRVTMETRVRLADNLITENAGGLYLQRSEVTAEHNTIWQDWRFLEDKPSLGPSFFRRNILKGPLERPVEARATFEENMAEATMGGADTRPVEDCFLDDGIAGRIAAVRFNAEAATTFITVVDPLPAAALARRPVRVGTAKNGRWYVIREGSGRTLALWGRLEAETHSPTEFSVLRTFTVRSGASASPGARR